MIEDGRFSCWESFTLLLLGRCLNLFFITSTELVRFTAAMKKVTILAWLIVFTVCSLCGKDFAVIGRHSWRCKSRVNNGEDNNNATSSLTECSLNYLNTDGSSSFVCCCGKHCKGEKGLRIHQRSCKTIGGLAKQIISDLSENTVNEHLTLEVEPTDVENTTSPVIKTGVKLPDNTQDWSRTNLFFQTNLNTSNINDQNLDHCVEEMNNRAYNYFKDNLVKRTWRFA